MSLFAGDILHIENPKAISTISLKIPMAFFKEIVLKNLKIFIEPHTHTQKPKQPKQSWKRTMKTSEDSLRDLWDTPTEPIYTVLGSRRRRERKKDRKLI